jgi:hypothetical protein
MYSPSLKGWNSSTRLSRGLDALQIALAVLATALGLRGEGHALAWLGLAVALPILRAALSPAYERRLYGWLGRGGAAPLWPAALLCVVLPATALFLANNRHGVGGDDWPVVSTACSLASEGSFRLDRRLAVASIHFSDDTPDGLPYGVLRRGDGVYSKYPYGMVPFALPFAALARLGGADLMSVEVVGRISKWAGAWTTAWALGLFWLLARRLAGPRPAAWGTLFLTLGSALFSICGQSLCQHSGLAFWLLVVLTVEFRETDSPVRGGYLLQGLACGMMLACRPTAALMVVPLGMWLLVRSLRRAVLVTATTCLVYAPWALLYLSIHGSPMGPYILHLEAGERMWHWPSTDVVAATLISPGRGLLVYQPWLLVALVGALLWRSLPRVPQRGPAGWRLFCLAVFLLHLLMVSCFRIWWGGHCWGTRYLAEVMPLLALLCLQPLALLTRRPAGVACFSALLVVSFALHAAAIFGHADYWNARVDVDNRPEMVWSWSRAPFLDAFARR